MDRRMIQSLFNSETLQQTFFSVANAICPPRCLSCDALGASPFCLICENALLHSNGPPPQSPDRHLGSLWLYGGPLSQAYGKTKFSKQPLQMKRLLTWLLMHGLTDKHQSLFQQHEWGMISWVPAHPFRRLQRGFNAAHLFAILLGAHLQIPVAACLECIRHDAPFSMGSSKADRQKSIQGRYRARTAPSKAKILLVDDICTTGATLGEASKQLAQTGTEAQTFSLAQTPKQA